mmetsp:Transcript_33734/g.81685  ORF Transcript_33734/g.81685 Transcript_33734/m.81685 type:complete len:224 (-) Transcript_33734:599-1270(-)
MELSSTHAIKFPSIRKDTEPGAQAISMILPGCRFSRGLATRQGTLNTSDCGTGEKMLWRTKVSACLLQHRVPSPMKARVLPRNATSVGTPPCSSTSHGDSKVIPRVGKPAPLCRSKPQALFTAAIRKRTWTVLPTYPREHRVMPSAPREILPAPRRWRTVPPAVTTARFWTGHINHRLSTSKSARKLLLLLARLPLHVLPPSSTGVSGTGSQEESKASGITTG